MSFLCKIGFHTWNGCKCDKCTKTRDKQHLWDGYTCTRCGIKRSNPAYTDERDGQVYKYIKIGNQIWFNENLRYKATNGCWSYENNERNVTKYGYLYNWNTAIKVCPSGWHLPSDAEWTELINYLGGDKVAGAKVKSISGWTKNIKNNNDSGFSALPGGSRANNGTFGDIEAYSHWWSSTEGNTDSAWSRGVFYGTSEVYRDNAPKGLGFSVRCIKDSKTFDSGGKATKDKKDIEITRISNLKKPNDKRETLFRKKE